MLGHIYPPFFPGNAIPGRPDCDSAEPAVLALIGHVLKPHFSETVAGARLSW